MNIVPSQSTLHAFGNNLSSPVPASQTKVTNGTPTTSPQPANATQRADAVARSEAPDRSTPSVASRHQEAPPPPSSDRRATRVDILV